MEDILKRATDYWFNTGTLQLAHFRSAEAMVARAKGLGIPTTVISAVVATSIFATLSESVDPGWRIATGIIAVLAAILAALQAFLNFGDLAEKHKSAAAKYQAAKRNIDLFILEFGNEQSTDRDKALEKLKHLTDELNSLSTQAPTLTRKRYDEAKRDFHAENRERLPSE